MKSKSAGAQKREILFLKSLNLLKSNPGKAGLMVLFDVLFITSFIAAQIAANYFAQSIIGRKDVASLIIFVLLSLLYYLLQVFVYSFFKYSIMDFISSLFNKTEFSFKRLGQFYSLNIVIAGIFFAVAILINLLLASIKMAYQPYVFIFLIAPFLLFLYIIINISHSLFYQGASLKAAIKNAFAISFTKIRHYRETILIIILAVIILWLLSLASGYLIRLLAAKNYGLYLTTYAYFTNAVKIAFNLVIYFVVFVNRVSFYSLIMHYDKK